MLKSHEILGTDKPIFSRRESDHYFLEELLLLGENPENYQIVGYVQIIKFQEVFFIPVYSLDLSNFKYYNKSNLKKARNAHARIIRFPQKNV